MTSDPASALLRPPSRLAALARRHAFLTVVATYGVGQAAMKLVDVLAFALLVNVLTPADFGFVGAATASGFVVTDVLSLGVFRVGAPRFIADRSRPREDWIGAGVFAFLVYAAIWVPVAVLAPERIGAAAGVSGYAGPYRLFLLSFIVRAFAVMHLEALRMEHRVRLQTTLEALPSVANLAIVAGWWAATRDGLTAAAMGQLGSWAMLAVIVAPRSAWPTWERARLVPALVRYSAPLVLQRLLTEFSTMAGRWVALAALGFAAAGAFTFFARLGEFIRTALAPVQKAWMPTLLREAALDRPGPVDRAALQFLVLSTLVFFAGLIGLPLLAPVIDLQRKYAAFYGYVGPVVYANYLYQLYVVPGAGLFLRKASLRVLLSSAAAAGFTVAAYAWLARQGGVGPMAYAAVIGNAVFLALTWGLGRRLHRFADRRVEPAFFACLALATLAFVADRWLRGGF